MKTLLRIFLGILAILLISNFASRAAELTQQGNPESAVKIQNEINEIKDEALRIHQSLVKEQNEIADKVLRDHLQPVLDVLRQQTSGDTILQYHLSRIKFAANPWNFDLGNARAYLERDSSAGVIVDTVLLLSIISLSELSIMEMGPYMQQAVKWWKLYYEGTRKALKQGLAIPAPILQLEEYVLDPLDREFIRKFSQRVYDPAMAWVILHEIAHHDLKHFEKQPDGAEQSKKRELRQLELDADDWAFRKLQGLNYPLRGVYEYLVYMANYQAALVGLMDGENKIASSVRLKEFEKGSTHPLWDTRAKALARNFDINAQPKSPWISFTAMDDLMRKDGKRELFEITVFFPEEKRASIWGFSQLSSNRASKPIPVWVEYKDGQAYLYGGNGHLKLIIKKPRELSSEIEYLFYGQSGNVINQFKLFGWYDTFAKYQSMEIIKGVTLYEGLELGDPVSFLRGAIDQTDWDQSLRDKAIGILNGCTVKLNELSLQYQKGIITLTEQQRQSMLSKTMEECQEVLKNKLGEGRMKALGAKILEDKKFGSGFIDLMKQLNESQGK